MPLCHCFDPLVGHELGRGRGPSSLTRALWRVC